VVVVVVVVVVAIVVIMTTERGLYGTISIIHNRYYP
jgi:hypothetical protein